MIAHRYCHPALVALSMLAHVACSDEAVDSRESSTRRNPTDEDGPLYVVATSFEVGEERETYLVTTESFDEDTEIDPRDGPHLLGGVVPIAHGGAVYVPDAGRPVIMRYEPGDDGRLEKTGEVSFMAAGVTEVFSWHTYIVNDTKGYVFDQAGARIVVWNPKTMKVTGTTIDLADLGRRGWVPNLVFEHSGPVQRTDALVIPLGWQDQDENSRRATGALLLDVEEDEVIAALEDERCGESYVITSAPGGDLYFFPPDWSAAPHYFDDKGEPRPTCVLRIRAGEQVFDPDYTLDLSKRGSGSAAAGAVPDGEGGFFFTALDEKLWDDGENEGGEVWRFYHSEFASERSHPVESLPLWSTNCYYVNVGGDLYIPREEETDDGLRTTFYAVRGADDPIEWFSFDASWYGAVKLR